jgi:hypothetical protein
MGLKEAFRRLNRHPNTSAEHENSIPVYSEPPELRHSPSLEMLMCRYTDGILRKEMVVLEDTKYIAISHVWGDARWQHIDGIEGAIMISDENAKFLTEWMPELVGEGFFWMDILCVNQHDMAARVAVTQYIPANDRNSRRGRISVLLLSSSNVPSDAAEFHYKILSSPYFDRLTRHYEERHGGEGYTMDGIISRLWPFQEVLVSDTVHFVQCQPLPRTRSMGDSYQPVGRWYSDDLLRMSLVQIVLMGKSWEGHGSARMTNVGSNAVAVFVDVYLRYRVATRSPITRTLVKPDVIDFAILQPSARRTTRSQDFILALMP